ncbi:MAG: DUF4249 family protein [bacterium]
MRNTFLYIVVILSFFFITCEKNETEDSAFERQIIVDGWIEPGKPAHVILTWSVPYFSNTHFDTTNIYNFVHARAKVTVSDGENSEVLALGVDTRYFPPYIYKGVFLKGETGKTYTLTVEDTEHFLMATTTLKEPPVIKSLVFKPEAGYDSLGCFQMELEDIIDSEDHYRILYALKGNTEYEEVFIPNISDELFRDKTIQLQLYRSSLTYKEEMYFSNTVGVAFKVMNIDKSAHEFYKTLQLESINTFNPFAESKLEVKSNITGGGLGLWSARAVTIKTVTFDRKNN